MLAYTFKRLLTLIPTLLAASILVFLFVHLIPGDPAAILLGDTATPEEVAQLSAEMGFDRPLWIQYFLWLGNVVQGDLGTSIFFRENQFCRSLAAALKRQSCLRLDDDGLDHYHRSADWCSLCHQAWHVDRSDHLERRDAGRFHANILARPLSDHDLFRDAWAGFQARGFPSLSDEGGITNLTLSAAAQSDAWQPRMQH